MFQIQNVFVTNGVPDITFVKPKEYMQLLVALRTPGKGVVLEGPSGIGKTTAFMKAVNELPENSKVQKLSARKATDVEIISELASLKPFGFVIIDDFHKLSDDVKQSVADLMKVIADESDVENKIVVAGINKAGENLISFAYDLANRIEVITFEANPVEKVEELIALGEGALNVRINIKSDLVAAVRGSFYLAQLLCYNACIFADILHTQPVATDLQVSLELVLARVQDQMERRFKQCTVRFCQGSRLRAEGRAPYLHLLYGLSKSDNWVLAVDKMISEHREIRNSLAQAKSYLPKMIEGDEVLNEVLYFDDRSSRLIVQDPQYMFYLRGLSWSQFASQVGYISIDFPAKYDFALSFAGTQRGIASALFQALQEMEFAVFYDKNEQFRIVAADVEDYLRPIYQSEASFVVVILSNDYPTRIWTRMESDSFRARFEKGEVIPVLLSDVSLSVFDSVEKIGRLSYDLKKPPDEQIREIVEILRQKIAERRHSATV